MSVRVPKLLERALLLHLVTSSRSWSNSRKGSRSNSSAATGQNSANCSFTNPALSKNTLSLTKLPAPWSVRAWVTTCSAHHNLYAHLVQPTRRQRTVGLTAATSNRTRAITCPGPMAARRPRTIVLGCCCPGRFACSSATHPPRSLGQTTEGTHTPERPNREESQKHHPKTRSRTASKPGPRKKPPSAKIPPQDC